ncbi:hypothetical protein O181_095846 [Austropuccinia psidii MF-1]|uniref:Uncharacterized protein n=1 Tax=Austropuccinia psidii MF-1 TaxID=1389203 RepID=A0A9Q3PDQ0_9BASI|nr:hypothetical protein [Austropuccinia psidii MF-1]
MSYKLTEITEYSPPVPPPPVLCESSVFIKFLNLACTECLKKGKQCFEHFNPKSSKFHHFFVGKKQFQHPWAPISNIKRYLWSKKDGHFGKEFPVSEAPNNHDNSGYYSLTGSRQSDFSIWTNVGEPIPAGCRPIYSSSKVPISTINNKGVVKRMKRIFDSPTNPDAEGSDYLDGEEVELMNKFIFQLSRSSPTQPPAKMYHIQVVTRAARNFKPVFSTLPSSIPPPSPNPSTSRLALAS